ncbi:MAG: histidine phosphatase family protein [Myxococcota bacterium]|nr:histidine phosphatase family protein [Myxococcota bacterium]
MKLVSRLASLRDSGAVPVLLCRHGRTRYNAERRFVGRLDVPLDPHGEAQAKAWAARMAELPVQGVYSSPMLRAKQTAQALDTPVPITGLQELDQGEFEGRPGAEVIAAYPEFFAQWRRDPTGLRVPGGESVDECQARSVAALTSLARSTQPGAPIVVVAHQMVLASVLLHVLQLPLRLLPRVHQGNTAVNLLAWDGRWVLHAMNDRSHLPAALR